MNNTNTTSNTSQDKFNSGNQSLGGFGYTIGLCIAILILFMIMTYMSYVCRKIRDGASNLRQRGSIDAGVTTEDDSSVVTIYQDGLDDVTISAYPKFTYAQLDLHKNESTASGCSICLSDYKEKDVLRMLPDCGHFYHLKCIDPWLGIHATCPICRNSPLHTPIAVPIAQSS